MTTLPSPLPQLLDLTEPVADSHGIVYEKQDVLAYLRGYGAQPCPLAGA